MNMHAATFCGGAKTLHHRALVDTDGGHFQLIDIGTFVVFGVRDCRFQYTLNNLRALFWAEGQDI